MVRGARDGVRREYGRTHLNMMTRARVGSSLALIAELGGDTRRRYLPEWRVADTRFGSREVN